MAKETARPHIRLVCWDQPEAEEHKAALKKGGYRTTLVTSSVKGWIG
jgi:hypothetical protein